MTRKTALAFALGTLIGFTACTRSGSNDTANLVNGAAPAAPVSSPAAVAPTDGTATSTNNAAPATAPQPQKDAAPNARTSQNAPAADKPAVAAAPKRARHAKKAVKASDEMDTDADSFLPETSDSVDTE